MLQLICLEYKKNNIMKYILYSIILIAISTFLIFAVSRDMSAEAEVEVYGNSMILAGVGVFTHMFFIVFTGVMIASFVVGTYTNRTINLMFSYPINRKKILYSKILAVWIFNFIALILNKALALMVLLLTKNYTHIDTSVIQMGSVPFWMNILLSSAAMVSISFIALFVGLKMKSTKACIVTSVIIVALTQGNVGTYTMVDNIPFYSILFVISFISIFISIYNVETRDVM